MQMGRITGMLRGGMLKDNAEQWLLFLIVNTMFICKYLSRTSIHPFYGIIAFFILFTLALILYNCIISKGSRMVRVATATLLGSMIIMIGLFLYKIDPMSVNVDRWSATSYFLDGLFSGVYPYGIHTHVCETNFPSPFPLWQYINIPFWLLGDVGLGLIVFLLLMVLTIRWFTKSSAATMLALLLTAISPAYWWEVFVRSDGLSNAILVFSIILLMDRKRLRFDNHWLTVSAICGLLASTRLSAIIPMALYLGKSYFKLPFSKQVFSIFIAIFIVAIFFAPYIFWDTEQWIFFSRNPFMSQSSTGNVWILAIMAVLALFITIYYKDIHQFSRLASVFVFSFFLLSICYNHLRFHADVSFFDDADFDISYLTLSLPYCLFAIVNKRQFT